VVRSDSQWRGPIRYTVAGANTLPHAVITPPDNDPYRARDNHGAARYAIALGWPETPTRSKVRFADRSRRSFLQPDFAELCSAWRSAGAPRRSSRASGCGVVDRNQSSRARCRVSAKGLKSDVNDLMTINRHAARSTDVDVVV
jgi:hypothetical protein